MKSLRIALLFGIALAVTATASAQQLSSNTVSECDGICYTDEMDKAAIECWNSSEKKDSLLKIADTAIGELSFKIETCEGENRELSEKLERQEVKTKRNRKLAIGGFSAAIASVLLWFVVK